MGMQNNDDGDLLMRDYAASDPRSVKSWLRGEGDDRNARFEEYMAQAGDQNPEQAQATYSAIKYQEYLVAFKQWREDMKAMNAGKPLGDFTVAVIGLLLGVLVYLAFNPSFFSNLQ